MVDINKSDYGFKPDVENNEILFGLKALSGINGQTIEHIKAGRPYLNIADFLYRCPLDKRAMINLIKAGAFDKYSKEYAAAVHPRVWTMIYYLSKVYDEKKRITLQNFNGLINYNLIPQELDFQKRVFLFNKYLKANKKVGKYFTFDEACEKFYNEFFDENNLEIINGITCIKQNVWDDMYQLSMDTARTYFKEHQAEMLQKLNQAIFKEVWDKYAQGNISAWEMEALCFYYNEHELAHVNIEKYGLVDFNQLSPEPEIEYTIKRNNNEIPIFKTYKIIGTIISKNDIKNSICILTTTGVVTVKFTKEYFAMYNRQLSEVQADGTKKVLEKGWFTRGVKIMVTGFRRDDTFVAKTYSKTQTHQLYKIEEVNEKGEMKLQHERIGTEI